MKKRGKEGGSCPEEVRQHYREMLKEERARVSQEEPVARECTRVLFVSRSKARGRARKQPKEVELICRGGRCVAVVDGQGPFDDWATEILGDAVDPAEAEQEFLRRVRRL